ncbi:hypothetical protein FN846DRAFT_434473, partial [Sphaerosporella brunnea]
YINAFNTSISLTELILSTAFELGQTTLESVSALAETYVLTLDSIFGSTETSRAISEIVKLIREEFKDSTEHDGEVSIRDIVAGLTSFAILQYRTHSHLDSEITLYGRLMWDVVVDAAPPVSATAVPGRRNKEDIAQDRKADDPSIPAVLLEKFPANAEISISTSSTTTSTTTIEVIGTSPPEFTPPPGAVVLSETSQPDGRSRYKIVYETVTRNEQSKRLKREDGGEVELVAEDEQMMDIDEQRVFEIEEASAEEPPRIRRDSLGKHQRDERHSKRKDVKVMGSPQSGSDTERPAPVPKKTRINVATCPSIPRSTAATANQPKKRTSAEKKKEREREHRGGKEKDKDTARSMGNTLRKAFSPPTFGMNEKKRNDKTAPNRTQSYNSLSLQASPNGPRNRSRRPSVQSTESRPASPQLHHNRRHSGSRTTYHRESYAATSTHHDAYNGIHSSYSPRRPELPSRPNSAISTTSFDGDYAFSQQQKHYPSSVYTMHTSHSTTSLHLLYRPPTIEEPGPCYPTSFHLLHNLRKYIRFAAASYGSQFMRLLLGSQFLPPPELEHHLEHQAFSFHTSLPVDTILLSSHYDPSGGFDSAGHTGTGRPLVHFVCVDHEAAAIVVTCRGTLGLEDVLTDLTCEYTSIILRGNHYRVHKGMYNSAILLLRSRLLHSLASALQSYPNYGLVLTGHSLGAGVAALASILIASPDESGAFVTAHEALPQGRPVHCYAFGSPAIVCEPLRKATRGLVTTVVNGNDVVPSLSIGVVRDFHSVALSFKEDTGGVLGEVRKRFVQGLWGRSASEEEWCWELAVLKTLRAGMTAEKLVPPGEVWRVLGEKDGVGLSVLAKKRARAWVVEDVGATFGEVKFAKKCFGDHSPGAYEETLEALSRGVLGEE